jgi:hypothetical protein
MKKRTMLSTFLLLFFANYAIASDIIFSSDIPKIQSDKLQRDLEILESFNFTKDVSPKLLEIFKTDKLDGQTASSWLNERVHVIATEKDTADKNIYVTRRDVEYPNSNIVPYSADYPVENKITNLTKESTKVGISYSIMSNLAPGIYRYGKSVKKIYGMILKAENNKSYDLFFSSPRLGLLQINEGLFLPGYTLNKNDPNALADRIFRLSTLFHEARHSDGSGESLGFGHVNCPDGHDYAGDYACDENLNGPYTVGALMMTELLKNCAQDCTETESETLKLMILDSANRVLKVTHKGEVSKNWDDTPEGID